MREEGDSERKVIGRRKIESRERDFILRNCLCTARKINPVPWRALPAAGFFFELFDCARAHSRAMARYFGRRHGAQWAKRYY